MKPLQELQHLASLDWEVIAPLDWQVIPYLRIAKVPQGMKRRKISVNCFGGSKILLAVSRDAEGLAEYLGYYEAGYDFCGPYVNYRQNLWNSPIEAIDSRLILGIATAEEIETLVRRGNS